MTRKSQTIKPSKPKQGKRSRKQKRNDGHVHVNKYGGQAKSNHTGYAEHSEVLDKLCTQAKAKRERLTPRRRLMSWEAGYVPPHRMTSNYGSDYGDDSW